MRTPPHSAFIPIHAEPDGPQSEGRRAFMKWMAASMALAGSACSGPPNETILPYVQMPENLVPGQPQYYATAFTRAGRADGVLVQSQMGRPIKVEGNPRHPSSLGATDVFAQASILQLWDPDRSQNVRQGNALSTWQAFISALDLQRSRFAASHGEGLRILSPALASPTLARQRRALLEKYPRARWHIYDPLQDLDAMQAARLAWKRPAHSLLRLDRAQLVLCLDADIFGDWPGSIRHARDFASRRLDQNANPAKRLVAIESTPTLTGAMAEQRLALAPREIERSLWRLARLLGMPVAVLVGPAADSAQRAWESALATQLQAMRGRALVVAGPGLSAASRALVHAMNTHLANAGNTVQQIALLDVDLEPDRENDIASLAADMNDMQVHTLFILGGNPVYDAPADLEFASMLDQVEFSVHLGLYRDETARRSAWHVPQAHCYEHWSDARAFDGTASIVQPLIAPLYGGHSTHEVIALLTDGDAGNAHALVRATWRGQAGQKKAQGTAQGGDQDFEAFWQTSLRQGLIADSASAVMTLAAPDLPEPPPLQPAPPLVARFVGDASCADGAFANNAWLQELPRPLTKLTWDNAALMSEASARALGAVNGDLVELNIANSAQSPVTAPVWIQPGHADGVISLPLGYGRSSAGRVGNGVGFNAYALRTVSALRADAPLALQVRKTGRRHLFAQTQRQADMEGREPVRLLAAQDVRRNAHEEEAEKRAATSLYPEIAYRKYKWGMAIDLDACTGCSVCTIACQAENNIPVVGKEEVIRGRAMHWIRVDRYYTPYAAAGAHQPRTVFQPVPCMHCEHAPCEEVCPVGATVHDSEGLNVQVYNRCVGTRFCSNNCPYKVRRFNFLQYSNTKEESLKALQNPEVTVRRRGVMEKCTYCLQRITRARLEAEKRGQRIRDGEVVTACQAACPTGAIVFGDLNDPDSQVNRAKASPRNYDLLAELNTRPRTSYLARIVAQASDRKGSG